MTIKNIPGLRNSDEDHWQTHLERIFPNRCSRVQQVCWDEPDCVTWIERMEEELSACDPTSLILTGHSIGCMAIVKWHERFQHIIKGALLVAPSDSERDGYPPYITGFTPIPMEPLPFPSIVVASTDDHVTTLERSKEFAQSWGSRLVILEGAGHIEPKSGFGEWPLGLDLLKDIGFE